MKKIFVPILLFAACWSACVKEQIPDGGSDNPVFSVGFETDSGSVSQTAGLAGIYLFTGVAPDANNVLVLSGAFADASCPTGDCPESVRFEFRNEWLENFVRPDSLFGFEQFWSYKSPQSTSPSFRTVSIVWYTPEGSVYRSDLFNQDSSTFFLTSNTSAWENNERGEKTLKMDISFSCWVIDSTQQAPEQRISGSGVIAVGYR